MRSWWEATTGRRRRRECIIDLDTLPYPSCADYSFLGYVDLLGTTYSAPTLATGFGSHIAIPLLREAYEAKAGIDGKGPLLTEEEAVKLLGECMKVLFYRDARSINKVSSTF